MLAQYNMLQIWNYGLEIPIFFHLNNYQDNQFDIYNPSTNTWSVGVLDNGFLPAGAAIISVNNVVYVAGGSTGCISDNGGCSPLYNGKVWKLEF